MNSSVIVQDIISIITLFLAVFISQMVRDADALVLLLLMCVCLQCVPPLPKCNNNQQRDTTVSVESALYLIW